MDDYSSFYDSDFSGGGVIFMLFIAKIIHPLLILICFIYLFITFFMNRFLKEKEESKLCEEYFKVEVKKK